MVKLVLRRCTRWAQEFAVMSETGKIIDPPKVPQEQMGSLEARNQDPPVRQSSPIRQASPDPAALVPSAPDNESNNSSWSPPPSAALNEIIDRDNEDKPAPTRSASRLRRIALAPVWCVSRLLDLVGLFSILAVVAAIPVVQFASLGYLLLAAANLAAGKPWSTSLPGLRIAGRLATFVLLATLSWLPVWFVTDMAYSAQLAQPGSNSALGWRVGAFGVTALWVILVSWAAIRGGRWWHFLWPAPIRFASSVWRPHTWAKASDDLYALYLHLQFPQLWWLGARAAAGVLLWIALPVSLMIIGLRAQDFPPAVLVGFVGALGMAVIMLYLPFLQINFAKEREISALFNIWSIRKSFRFAPWAHAFSLMLLCLLCLPLYLLRIEATPEQLTWAPAIVFVLFMLPAKIGLGAAMGYSNRRQSSALKPRHWSLRWTARLLAFASVLIYVGALYVAQLVAGQGAYVMYFQHAFLVPAPQI